MKKSVLGGILLAVILMSASADVQFRLTGDVASDFSRHPDKEVLDTLFNNKLTPTYGGVHWELILNRIGFGMHYLTYFTRSSASVGSDDEWLMHLNSDLFLSYHLFGAGAMLDPFAEIGYGIAGAFAWSKGSESWDVFDEHSARSLAFYAHVSAGLALDLQGFLIGAKLGYRPRTIASVPGFHGELHDVSEYQASVFGGIALGAH